ncbi:uncharacterized protein LOC131955875 [Physella acuta]|uniref:uncharacterized protein LOC131955875 n=1 Tax=Physella acuta TaxID=109671 RepID=UPI0027DC7E59|nr:uncharacterized protein LOC131955875 [Physella acuta]
MYISLHSRAALSSTYKGLVFGVSVNGNNDKKCQEECDSLPGCQVTWRSDVNNRCWVVIGNCSRIDTAAVTVEVPTDLRDTPNSCYPDVSLGQVTSSSAEVSTRMTTCPPAITSTVNMVSTHVTTTTTTTIATTTTMHTTTQTVGWTDYLTTTVYPACSDLSAHISLATQLISNPATPSIQLQASFSGSQLPHSFSDCPEPETVTNHVTAASDTCTSTLYVTSSSGPTPSLPLPVGADSPGNTLLSGIGSTSPHRSALSGDPLNSDPTTSLTPSQIDALVASIVAELSLDHGELSNSRRKKISAYDGRTTAEVSGVVACIFLGCSIACIVLLDVPLLVNHCMRRVKGCKR